MMKHLETYRGSFVLYTRRDIERATRQGLVEYLESRGSACYDDESTELLRAAALDDWDGEHSG